MEQKEEIVEKGQKTRRQRRSEVGFQIVGTKVIIRGLLELLILQRTINYKLL